MAKAAQSKVVDVHSDFEIPVELTASDGSRETISARIRRVNHGFFQLRTTQAIEVGRRFVMECDACLADLEVIYCQRPGVGACFVGARLLTGGESTARRELRIPIEIPASATVPGTFEGVNATVTGMSASGLEMLLPQAVEDGSMVAVDMGSGIIFGESRRCTPVESRQYQLEMTIDEFIARDHPSVAGKNNHSAPGFFSRLKNVFSPQG